MKLQTLTSIPEADPSPYRPYFNQKNADKMRPVFDDILANPRNVFLSCADNDGVSVSTLQNRILYALRFLDEQGIEPKYRELRSQITTRRRSEPLGVVIIYKASTLAVKPAVSVSISLHKEDGKHWFEEFTEWVNLAKPLELFDSLQQFSGIVEITEEYEKALIKLGAQTGMELDINRGNGSFRAMR